MRYFIIIFAFWSFSAYAESIYKDRPVQIDVNVQTLLNKYRDRAIQSLPYFNEKLKKSDEKGYFITTRLYEGDNYEQVFVAVSAYSENSYKGKIASTSMGKVKFNRDDPILVPISKVTDWLIVKNDGTEEGNLQGKILDLFQVGKAAFIYELIPINGIYSKFKVISVRNGKTKQEILDVVPKEALEKVERYVAMVQKGKKSKDGKTVYSYAIVKFPGWEILE